MPKTNKFTEKKKKSNIRIQISYGGLFSNISAVVELAIHSSLRRLPDEQADGHL